MIFRSPAKINLSLDILGVLPNGYHELQSVVHCIGLYDFLTFDFNYAPGIAFECSDATLQNESNLIVKAARAWLEAAQNFGLENFSGVKIFLNKQVPMGAGLGGGSANAAATLRALNDFHRELLDESSLLQIATKLGADVPLFLRGGCVLMEGVGEKLTSLPPLDGAVVVIVPDQHASTPAVYKRYDELAEKSNQSTPALRRAMETEDFPAVAQCLGNDLRQSAQTLGIDVELPLHLLRKHGARGAEMSGSGASSFGLFDSQNAAELAARKIREDASLPDDYKVLVAPLIAGGIARLKP
jgi:4-diphosphocytidyl-2-C-methyl-D-erythritol kinase